jgi:hypothetical protein
MTFTARLSWVALALSLATTVACSGQPALSPDAATPDRRLVNTGQQGPLTANKATGGFAADRPRGVPGRWFVSFGDFVLCSTEPHAGITIDSVRYAPNSRAAPLRVVPMLRTFTVEEVGAATPERRRDYATYLGALLGRPPYTENYAAGFGGAGHFSAEVEGVHITQDCQDAAEANGLLSGGRAPNSNFVELVFVVTANREGGTIDRAWVDYTANGRARTLRLDWSMTACGTRVRSLCA